MTLPTHFAIPAVCLLFAPGVFAASTEEAATVEKTKAPAESAKVTASKKKATPSAKPKASDQGLDTPAPKAKAKAAPATKCPACAPEGKGTVPPAPVRTWFPEDPFSSFTLGTMFSDEATGAYLDAIVGLWAPETRDAFVFLNGRFHWEDNDQQITSVGLGFRKLLPGHDVILGANAYYDSVHSEHGNDIYQLGLGVEVLTHWVDARFNYYLPENDQFVVGRSSTSSTHRNLGPGGIRINTTQQNFVQLETGLEGFNAEVGFLIPGLDKFAEVRAFIGYYHYDNPFGADFDGVKARLEARLLRGVSVGVEYWDDEELMGGHWTAEVGVTLPFSFYNLFTGKNPFEGAGESFQRLPRNFSDRLSDTVDRSHRIQTVTSGNLPDGTSRTSRLVPLPQSGGGHGHSGGDTGFPIE